MADTTEKKTYLINVESNLKQYAEEADKAAIKVAELTAKNEGLKKSSEATGAEIEASNAALRDAKKEYNNAKKMVDLQTAANNAEVGSRKQLESVLKLQMFELGKLGNAYVTNAQGMRVLNPLYVEQRNKIAATKKEIIAYDLALNDGRSNIGRYGESVNQAMGAISALPGPLGNAASAVQSFSGKLLAMLKNPVVLVITGVVAALMLLVKAFKGNDEASEKFSGILKGIGVVIKEVLGRIVSLGQAVVHIFKGEWKEAVEDARDAVVGLGKAIKDAYNAGTEQQLLANKIEDAEIEILERIAKRNKEIAEIKKNSREEDEDALKRRADLLRAYVLEKANLNDQLAIQRDRVKLAELELSSTNKNQKADEQRRKVAQERAKLYELETESINAQGSIQKGLLAIDREITKESNDQYDLEEKIRESKLKRLNEKSDAGADEIKRLEEKYEREQDLRNRDIEAGFEYHAIKNQDNLNALNTLIDQEYAALLTSVGYTRMTNNEKLLAEEQYNQAKKELSDRRIQQQMMELDAISNLSGSLADLFGRQTVAAKILSVSQALISTYTAGVKAMAELPLGSGPVLRFATLAGIIAAGMAQVKNILAVKVPGGGSSGQGAPSSISSVPMAQRMMAGQVGSSIFTQSQMSQSQLNALPQSGGLTVEQLTEAFKNLPAPITTIEDINARAKSTNKITSRANI